MKQFLIFAGKEFRHIFRDRRTMLILLVMPVVQIRRAAGRFGVLHADGPLPHTTGDG